VADKSVLLVGNGFVKAVNGVFAVDHELAAELAEIQTLWDEFGSAFGDVANSGNPILERMRSAFRTDPETALDAMQATVTFVSRITPIDHLWGNLLGGDGWTGCQTECVKNLQGAVTQCMYSVVQRFMDAEVRGFYSRLTNSPSQSEGLCQLQAFVYAGRDDLAIFTTNYDGLCDQLLAWEGGSYFMGDGFGGYGMRPQEKGIWFDWGRASSRLRSWTTIAHLHGSYKFAMVQDLLPSSSYDCIKLNDVGYEDFHHDPLSFVPVVVLDIPSRKIARIQSLPILKEYYESLRDRMQAARRIVIWGLSLSNDAHIADAIGEAGDAWPPGEGELVVIDPKPDDVLDHIDWHGRVRRINPAMSSRNLGDLVSLLSAALPDFARPASPA